MDGRPLTVAYLSDGLANSRSNMRLGRREFIRGLGLGALVLSPISGCQLVPTTLAPDSRVRRIGFLVSSTRASESAGLIDFVTALRQAGWDEGRNLVIEWREGNAQSRSTHAA